MPPLLLLSTFFLLSCGLKGKSGTPEWVYNFKAPKKKICGVGSAYTHVRGFPYQKATAIARAIDEIARQKRVEVKVDIERLAKGSSQMGYKSQMEVYSFQTTKGEVVKAKIIETYYDKEKGLFHVLMCEER